jgi:hypothetical protein
MPNFPAFNLRERLVPPVVLPVAAAMFIQW